jgi:ABC-2 type transport system permease protein
MPHVAPSSWFVSLLLALRSAQIAIQPFFTYFMLILVVCSTVFALCLALGERLISAASVQEETEGAGQVTEAYSGVSRWWYRFFSPPIAAILRKDLLYVSRDSILLSQLMMPALLFIVPFALLGRGHGLYVREELFPFACGMVAIILFMQTSILSLSSIGLENRSFWQFLASPNTGRQLLWSKFLMSTGISGGIAIVLMLFTLLVCGMDGLALLLFPMGTLISAAGLCGLGVGISAMFPRFIYENPAHRVSTWAMILGFFGSVGYMLITTVLFVGAVFLSNFWETPLARYAPLIALVLHLLITIYLVFVSLIFGAKRIEKYAWEH